MSTDPHSPRSADGDPSAPDAGSTPSTTAAAGPLPGSTTGSDATTSNLSRTGTDDETYGRNDDEPLEQQRTTEIDGDHAAAPETQRLDTSTDETGAATQRIDPDPAPGPERTSVRSDTPDDDAVLRDERARRFGRRQPSTDDDLGTPVASTTATTPVAQEQGSTQAMPATSTTGSRSSETGDDPFSEFDDGPTSRAAAHWWSILASVVLTPVAWFLIADGGERTSFSLDAGNLNIAGPIELGGGALALFFLLLAARWSSVGAIIVGSVSFAVGVAYLAVNEQATQLITDNQDVLVRLGQLGQNALDFLLADLSTGRFALYGLVLIMAGVISHGARRQGRREERRKAAIGV